jgi:hypothetical protein
MGRRVVKEQGYKQNWTDKGLANLHDTALANRPWEKSTGPRSAAGKAISKMNAFKNSPWGRLDRSASFRQDLKQWLLALDPDAVRDAVTEAYRKFRLANWGPVDDQG